MKPKPGDRVALTKVPPGFLDDLPEEDQQAINEVVGKPIQLNGYDEDGSAELEFQGRKGTFHTIWVKPDFIGAPNDSELRFDALHKLIKNSDIISLRRELDLGMSPNLSSRVLLDPAHVGGSRREIEHR